MRRYEIRLTSSLAIVLLAWSAGTGAAAAEFDAQESFHQLCAGCHGARRYGGYSPPLLPETLARKQEDALVTAILTGLPNTQMPPFAGLLDERQARAMVALLREPVAEIEWTLADIAASRVEERIGRAAIGPEIDRENLILVVERGSGSVSVLDGDRLQELDRFSVGRIHGGIKFDRGLHRALAVTRDGTLVDYDLDRGAARVRVKVGVNTRNIALSPEGDFIAAANQLPQGLVILDADLHPIRVFPLPGQPSAVYQLPGSQRFILTLRDQPHLYFLDYSRASASTTPIASPPGSPPTSPAGSPTTSTAGSPATSPLTSPTTSPSASSPNQRKLTLTRIDLPEPFEDFVFVPGKTQLIASSRKGSRLQLYDYESNEVVASLPTEGLPHLFSASFFEHGGSLHAALNHMGVPRLSLIDLDEFEVIREVTLLGAGFFTRTHPGTPYLWIDSNTESIQLVDKESLELVETVLTPEAGKKAMHVEFTASGDKALVSVWHADGAVVVYDSRTLEELRRLPYAMPVGKYNAANKARLVH